MPRSISPLTVSTGSRTERRRKSKRTKHMALAGRKKQEEAIAPREPVDRDEQLLVRAAWLSYVGGMTQAQIAKRLGLNRIRVNRMLAQARDQGVVQIRINSRITNCV